MAFDLRAILSLKDDFSSPMRKVGRQVAKTQRLIDKMGQSTDKSASAATKAGRQYSSFGKNVSGLNRGLGGLTTTLFGVAGAYAAMNTSKKIFDSTVLEAAKFEQSNVVIGAMFDDKKLSEQYTKMVDRIATKSPVLDSQNMYGSSKSFITTSKDLKQLEKMWGLAERMAAIDPMQGVEGSVFALKELFSGDAVSMVERFEMPRKIMNEIKKLPLEKQLVELDKYFNKIGMTTKLIDKMGGTTLGKWAQVKEKFNMIMRDMGQPALEPLVGFFDNLLARFDSEDFARFGRVGGRIIENVVSGLTKSAVSIYDWFVNLSNSDKWKQQTTVYGKVSFLIEDISEKFTDWYKDEGKEKLEKASRTVLETVAAVIDSSPKLVDAAAKLGKSIGAGLIEGFNETVSDSFILSVLGGSKTQIAYAKKKGSKMGKDYLTDKFKDHLRSRGKETDGKKEEKGKSHNGGLSYVPYSGYSATLHKGETVLTRGEARDYREGKSGGNTYQFGNIVLNGVGGDLEKAADKLLDIMAYKISVSGNAGAQSHI